MKLLSGAQFSVQCSPDDTLAQLRRRLEEQREGLRRCKLNLRVREAGCIDLYAHPASFASKC